jgi:hypothetical protein
VRGGGKGEAGREGLRSGSEGGDGGGVKRQKTPSRDPTQRVFQNLKEL